MSRKNTVIGISFIVLAILIIISKLGILPHLPILKIVLTTVFLIFIYEGARKKNFYEMLIPAALIGCIFAENLGIEKITPGPLITAAVFIAVGLDIMFKNSRDNDCDVIEEYNMDEKNKNAGNYAKMKNCEGFVSIENGFGSTNHYIDSKNLRGAKIQNSFGATNIYFNNAEIEGESANVKIENSFGNVNIHIPSKWALNLEKENLVGNVAVHGYPTNDSHAKIINVKVENGIGNVNIYVD